MLFRAVWWRVLGGLLVVTISHVYGERRTWLPVRPAQQPLNYAPSNYAPYGSSNISPSLQSVLDARARAAISQQESLQRVLDARAAAEIRQQESLQRVLAARAAAEIRQQESLQRVQAARYPQPLPAPTYSSPAPSSVPVQIVQAPVRQPPPYSSTSPAWTTRANNLRTYLNDIRVPDYATAYRLLTPNHLEFRPYRRNTRQERMDELNAEFTARRRERETEHNAYMERARTHWATQRVTYQSGWYSTQVETLDAALRRTFGQNPPAQVRASVVAILDAENEERSTFFTNHLRTIESLLEQETATFRETDATYVHFAGRITEALDNETGIMERGGPDRGTMQDGPFYTYTQVLLPTANVVVGQSDYDQSRGAYSAASATRTASFATQVQTWNQFASTDSLVRTAVVAYRADEGRRTAIRTSRTRFETTHAETMNGRPNRPGAPGTAGFLANYQTSWVDRGVSDHEAWYNRQIARLGEKLARDFTGDEPSEAIRAPLVARLDTELAARRTYYTHPQTGRIAHVRAERERRNAFLTRIQEIFDRFSSAGTAAEADAEIAPLWQTEETRRTQWEQTTDALHLEYSIERDRVWGDTTANPIDALYTEATRTQFSRERCNRIRLEKDVKQKRIVGFSAPAEGQRTWTPLFTFGRATQNAERVVTRTGGMRGFACQEGKLVFVVDWAEIADQPNGPEREAGLDNVIRDARTANARRWVVIFDGNRLKSIHPSPEQNLAFGRAKLFTDENLDYRNELMIFMYATGPSLRFFDRFAYRVDNNFRLVRAGGPFAQPGRTEDDIDDQ